MKFNLMRPRTAVDILECTPLGRIILNPSKLRRLPGPCGRQAVACAEGSGAQNDPQPTLRHAVQKRIVELYSSSVLAKDNQSARNDLAKVCHSGARVDAIAGPWGFLPNGSQGSPCGIAECWSAAHRHKPGRCRAYSRVFQARLCCRKLSAF